MMNRGKAMSSTLRNWPVAVAAAAFACASVVQVPSSLSTARGENVAASIEITDEVQGESSSGFSNRIRGGTVWKYVGTLEQGLVYRPRDTVLTVEGAHIHEAYLVVKDGQWVGYYLPVEKAFSPNRSIQKLSVKVLEEGGRP
jgi:hypothetical protein